MDRRAFVRSGLATAGCAAGGLPASAAPATNGRTTQRALFAALPRPKAGDWVRLVMGSGVEYQKQIGAAGEATDHGPLLYYETQVGTPGGSCNPNTMKRAYLGGAEYASLFDRPRVVANVANSGTTLTRWSDVGGGQPESVTDARLQLLDLRYLYDERPLFVVSSGTTTVRLPAAAHYEGSAGSARGTLHTMPVKHIVVEFAPPSDANHKLTRVELWTTPAVPFGVARYRATAHGLDPFEIRLYSYGTRFKTDLALTLQTIRALTPDGTHVQTT